uniref:Metabotropic glutamate receptor 3-like n=1 Tax=Saccoglossus kowalevskii TaxID=10224 RepID=A0ABM0GKY4_SACKO|nr:PREDICTED: metabotropic glutamate receptor 3-like [Saccoglossus kowalevskii]
MKVELCADFIVLMLYHLVLVTPCLCWQYSDIGRIKYSMSGDKIIGGLFPLHDYDHNKECRALRDLGTLLRMEAMVYAIYEINNRDDILPNMTIGFEIYDTCTRESTSIAQTLRFMPMSAFRNTADCQCVTDNGACSDENVTHPYVDVVIGTEMSFTTIPAAQLLGLSEICQISYYATSDDLSNKKRFPFFLRLSPPDKLQVKTMIDLMKHFNWTFISIVHSDDNYGNNGLKELKMEAEIAHICIAGTIEVSAFMTNNGFDYVVHSLLSWPRARVVVMFVHVKEANGVLSAIGRANATHHFQLIGSDGWAASIEEIRPENRVIASSVLKINLYSAHFQPFEDYFMSLNPENNQHNPWFEEFWQKYLNCTSGDDKCTEMHLPSGFSRDNSVSLVIDSVYTFALGWENMRRDMCPNSSELCTPLKEAKMDVGYLHNLTFNGATGSIMFDRNGDLMGKYDIHTIQRVGDAYQLLKLGIWDSLGGDNKLMFSDNLSLWLDAFPGTLPPSSYCSDPCSAGEMVIQREHVCCWDCVLCRSNEITVFNATMCQECLPHMWPEKMRTHCEAIPPSFIKYQDPWAIMLCTFSAVGLTFCFITLIAFTHYNSKPLVKATSRELSYIMFIGIILSYVLVYSFLAMPTTTTCYINRFGFMLSFTLTYGPLLTKTNRIFRIFDAGKKSTRRPAFISPRSQVTIALGMVFLQVIISTTWLIVLPPEAILIVPVPKEKHVELSCNISENEVITSLCFNVLLVVMCSYYAFKARKVPSNYNETRFITVSVYTTLVIWLAFIPTYFTTNRSYFKVTVLSLAMILNASVTLVCLYMPKIYAVHFLKEVDINAATHFEGATASGKAVARSATHFSNRVSPGEGPSTITQTTIMQNSNKEKYKMEIPNELQPSGSAR